MGRFVVIFDQSMYEEKIRWVASALHDLELFEARAKAAAEELGPTSIPKLAKMFIGDSTPPAEVADQFRGLGDWISARQFAIFEMFYNLGPSTLPVIRSTAFGEYDWPQGNAIEILCRMAADGIETEAIVAEIRNVLPNLRIEAGIYAFGPLFAQTRKHPELFDVLHRFDDIEEYREILMEIGVIERPLEDDSDLDDMEDVVLPSGLKITREQIRTLRQGGVISIPQNKSPNIVTYLFSWIRSIFR